MAAGGGDRLPPRGPVQLEPIVLPPGAAELEQAVQQRSWRRAPLRPLLQPEGAGEDVVHARADDPSWWDVDAQDDDEDAEDGFGFGLGRSYRTVRIPVSLEAFSPDCLPMDHTLPSLIRQVAGTDDLPSVKSIKLRVIGREMSLQRMCIYIPNLRELNLDGSSIGSLRELGCGLTGLRILHVSRCGLETLDGTFGFSSLVELYAAYNLVDDIGYLACLSNIEHIDLRGNRVSDIRYAGFLTVCHVLRELVLADNPCSVEVGYRATIKELLPNLQVLDGMPLGNYQEDVSEEDVVNKEDCSDRSGTPPSTSTSEAEQVDLPHSEAEASCSSSSSGEKCQGLRDGFARPSTASAAATFRRQLLSPSSSASAQWSTPARPQSAGGPVDTDAPSPLTSGGVVCGNLVSALRRGRARREAWGRQTGDTGAVSSPSTSGSCSSLSSWSTTDSTCFTVPESEPDHEQPSTSQAISLPSKRDSANERFDASATLSASRRWRQAYHQYRNLNRDRWEHEDKEVPDINKTASSGSQS